MIKEREAEEEPRWKRPKKLAEEAPKPMIDSEEFLVSNRQQVYNYEKEHAKNLGRYLKGWRHYENFEFYVTKNPGASIEEYNYEMYQAATHDQFQQLLRDYFI